MVTSLDIVHHEERMNRIPPLRAAETSIAVVFHVCTILNQNTLTIGTKLTEKMLNIMNAVVIWQHKLVFVILA